MLKVDTPDEDTACAEDVAAGAGSCARRASSASFPLLGIASPEEVYALDSRGVSYGEMSAVRDVAPVEPVNSENGRGVRWLSPGAASKID